MERYIILVYILLVFNNGSRTFFIVTLMNIFAHAVTVTFFIVSGIKKYIVGLIIKTSSEATTLEKEKVYLGKLNMILVQVCESF